LIDKLRAAPFILAPMAGITDVAFRTIMRELGSPIVITELVSANGLLFGGETSIQKTRKLMSFTPDQHPVGIQIFGDTLEGFQTAAREVQSMGADFVDLNFGCPVKKVVAKGGGSAILRDLPRLREVLQAVKSVVSIPVTIKIRTGWDEESRNADKVVQIAHDENILWVAIHGRTRSAGYTGLADWDYIRDIKKHSPLPIIGNGDIVTPELAVSRLTSSGCDGVMIGRGCLKNPWIFLDSLALYQGHMQPVANRQILRIIEKLVAEYSRKFDARMTYLQLKKFSAWYSSGFADASQFRKQIFEAKSFEETLDLAVCFFSNNNEQKPRDTTHEPFLMGGHG
jgi:tRNA-dihydrouridine synthase B